MNRRLDVRRAPPGLALLGLSVLAAPAAAQDAVATMPEVVVQSRRFEEQRTRIAPSLGASSYEIDRATIERLPQGANAPLNQVLLQAPGVVQEAQGDLHVRGDHRNLQYRINGVILPEAISGFGQLFDARGLRSVTLITGALPAQFGYRTAGIVDLRLRSGAQDPGGSAGVYGGSFGWVQPSLSYGAAIGPMEYHVTGSALRNERAFEAPTPARDALHNETRQFRGLLNTAYNLDDRTRLALIIGTSQARFQVPNVPGQPAAFQAFGFDAFDSARLRARQSQRSSFGVAAVQHARDTVDVQLSAFVRQSALNYRPDPLGDLLGTGVASRVNRLNWSAGVQGDAAWRVAGNHTLRAGFFVAHDVTSNRSSSLVLPLDGAGGTVDAPFGIRERVRVRGQLYGLYLQDEWRLTDRLTLNAGLRLDHMAFLRSASQASPRVNLVWRATDTTTVAVGYARYFTPPPAELAAAPDLARYAGTTLQPEVTRADAARPERSHYLNIGVRQRIGTNLTLGLEGFHRSVRDMQDLGQFGAAYLFSPYNYRRGRVTGAELSASYRRGGLLLYANGAYIRSEGRGISSNQYFFSAAELARIERGWVRTDHDQLLTASAGVSYAVWEGATLGSTLTYGSGMRKGFANSGSVTPYLTANLGFSQEFELPRAGRWTARLDVLNLFDRRYQLRDGSGIGVGAPQYGMRRGVFVGLARAL
ncbi:MAG: TonB-dependent receptor [Acetobacteraceae bacterium]|nr:TonB-dependent receptor [Acetobacteraceae bacterium]